MALPSKPLEQIVEADLLALIQTGEAESKIIDYKEALPGNSDSEKKEFLYDVSSFANAAGGCLVYGMKAKDGIPTDLPGIQQLNADSEKLRFHNMLQSGIQPRVPGVEIQDVKLKDNRWTLIVQIPRSWSSPHMVTFQGASKFYSRNSAGKYPLDVSEIRSAFLASETMSEKMSAFRSERIARILSNETPAIIKNSARVVFHLLPLSSFSPGFSVDLKKLETTQGTPFPPMKVSSSYGSYYNYEGLVYLERFRDNSSLGYTQVFRSGCIEILDSSFLGEMPSGKLICAQAYEIEIQRYLVKVFGLVKRIGLTPPFVFTLSLLNVRGYAMADGNIYGAPFGSHLVDRNHLLAPDVIIQEFDADLAVTLKPAFDVVWNACGYPGSKNYKENIIN